MPWWRNNQAFVLHMSHSTLLFLRGVANPLVFIKGLYTLYLVSSSWWLLQCGFIVKQSGLFRVDYPKHVSSPWGLDGPLCHSVSKPAVQTLLCTVLHYEVNTYGYKSCCFFCLWIYVFQWDLQWPRVCGQSIALSQLLAVPISFWWSGLNYVVMVQVQVSCFGHKVPRAVMRTSTGPHSVASIKYIVNILIWSAAP